MAVTGIDAAAYAKVIEGYYESFEKGFNWAGDRTMRELKFIFDNKYGSAKDVFKPNLTVNEAYNAIKQSDALLDDLTGTAYTIGQWGEEVFMKCVMFAGLFANRAGNGFGNLSLKAPRSPIRTFPQMPAGKGIDFNLTNLNSFKGAKSSDVSSWLEANGWVGVKTNPNRVYNDGMRYTNGVKGEQIRIMPGGATRSIAEKRGPYMEISIGGKKTVVQLHGNPSLNN